MAKRKIAVRVEEDLLSILEEVARGNGLTESDVIRAALAEYLERFRSERSSYDLATSLGIVGSARGLPRDLSTHRKHFEGFGK